MKKELTKTESFFYILMCIVSLGVVWLTKTILVKAMIDAQT